MDYKRHVIRSTVWLFTMSIFAAGFGYLTRLLLARNLTPTEFGLFYAVFALVGFFDGFMGIGVGTAAVKYIPEYRVKNDADAVRAAIGYYFWAQIFMYAVVAAGLLFASKYLATNYFKNESSLVILFILIAAFAFSILESLFTVLFQGYNKMIQYGFVNFFRALVLLSFVGSFLWMGFRGLAPAYAYLGLYICTPLVYFLLSKKLFPIYKAFTMPRRPDVRKQVASFAVPTAIGIAGTTIQNSMDTMIVTGFRTLEEVGLYNVALPTAGLLRFFSKSISQVVMPVSAELRAKGHEQFGQGVELLQKYSLIVILPVALSLISFPEVVLRILFGEQYVSAAPTLVILACASIIATLVTINSNILQGIGQSKTNSSILITGALVSVAMGLLLVPTLGIPGAAFAGLASQLVMLGFSAVRLKHYIQSHIPLSSWVRTLIAGLAFLGIIYILKSWIQLNPILEAIVLTILGCIGYGIVLLLTKTITVGEAWELVRKVL